LYNFSSSDSTMTDTQQSVPQYVYVFAQQPPMMYSDQVPPPEFQPMVYPQPMQGYQPMMQPMHQPMMQPMMQPMHQPMMQHPQPSKMEEVSLREISQFEREPEEREANSPCGWLEEGWQLYKENWLRYSLFQLLIVLLLLVGYLGPITFHSPVVSTMLFGLIYFVWPLHFGFFIAGSHIVRQREVGGDASLRASNLSRGFYLYFPLLLLILFVELLVVLGFILFVLPGLYLIVTLSFAPLVYIEYHHLTNPGHSVSICEAISLSRRVLHKNFCKILTFFLYCWFANFLGMCCFGVGFFVSMPVTLLASVFAFRDLFDLHPSKLADNKCYCC